MTELHIKNMVCDRCKMVVTEELKKNGLHPEQVDLGTVVISEELTSAQRAELEAGLNKYGFELLDDARSRTVDRIKKIIIQKIHYDEVLDMKVNWSALLADELHHDYKQLSSLYSSVEGVTIEQFIIRQKIERVKELLFYDELNLNEISFRLGYSSVQHLSTQFKKITGQTPSQFKAARTIAQGRRPLDSI